MPLKVTPTPLPEVLVIEPQVFEDERGFFLESFNLREFQAMTRITLEFVQDNHSRSRRNVLRGMHYQIQHPQGKLVRVISGSIFDVVIDIRRSSPQFGKWFGLEISAENKKQLWSPPGFAHGFLVTSDFAEVVYKTTDYRYAEHERQIRWDDPDVGINWPLMTSPILSPKDANADLLRTADLPT